MSPKLLKYDAARQALAAAHRVDEVKDIRDKALALEAYAKQAKDFEMQAWVTEIKLRAERRTGELLAETEKNAGNRGAGRGNRRSTPVTAYPVPKLSDLHITKNESSLWQRLAKIPEAEFEKRVKKIDVDPDLTTRKILRPLTPTRRSSARNGNTDNEPDELNPALREGPHERLLTVLEAAWAEWPRDIRDEFVDLLEQSVHNYRRRCGAKRT